MANLFRLSRYDLFLVAASILLCILLPLWLRYSSSPARSVKVTERGKVIATASLSVDRVITLHLKQGEMALEVTQGKIRVKECVCPQKICVLTGWVSAAGQSIVCVPNKVLVEVEGAENPEYDAVTY